MNDGQGQQEHLKRLQEWRNDKPRDLSLSFVAEQFKRQVEKPFKQMGNLAEIWQRLVPAALVERTALNGIRSGVLQVTVADSATLYELDRLLRGGLERQIREAAKATLKKIRLSQGPVAQP